MWWWGPTLSNTNCLGINCMIKTVSVHRLDNVIDDSIAEQWFLLIWVEASLWHSTYLLDFCSALISFSLSIVGFRLSSLFLFQISRFHFFLIKKKLINWFRTVIFYLIFIRVYFIQVCYTILIKVHLSCTAVSGSWIEDLLGISDNYVFKNVFQEEHCL